MPQAYQITEDSPLLHDANCVYCHVDLELHDHVAVCDECKSPHHRECWQANRNRCATFGCSGAGFLLRLSVESAPVDDEASRQPAQVESQPRQSYRPDFADELANSNTNPVDNSADEFDGCLRMVSGIVGLIAALLTGRCGI